MVEQTMLGQGKAVALALQYEVGLASCLPAQGTGIEPKEGRRAAL